jgi:hypothetical protein
MSHLTMVHIYLGGICGNLHKKLILYRDERITGKNWQGFLPPRMISYL